MLQTKILIVHSRELRIFGAELGTVGGTAFAEALRKNHCLVDLNLWGNAIGVESVKVLADTLHGEDGNSTLRRLNLKVSFTLRRP